MQKRGAQLSSAQCRRLEEPPLTIDTGNPGDRLQAGNAAVVGAELPSHRSHGWKPDAVTVSCSMSHCASVDLLLI